MDEDRRDLGGDSRGRFAFSFLRLYSLVSGKLTRNPGGNRSTTQSSSVSSSQNPGNNLHISGLSTRCDDKDLEELFGKFGRVGPDFSLHTCPTVIQAHDS